MGKQNIIRLKHLETISSNSPDYKTIMKDVLDYKPTWFFKKILFKRNFKRAHFLISSSRDVDLTKITYNDDCKILRPNNIDNISFRAMMELQSLLNNYNQEQDFGEFIAKVIATACYSQNYKGHYSSNNFKFNSFYKHILNSDVWQMVGLYNWIDKSLKESSKLWEDRFLSVEVEDKDYQQAGGQRMAQFNVITTIENNCADFNVDYDNAWQMSYALTQTNSYKKASANFTQDQMRKIKEVKMNSNRDRAK